MSKLWGGRFKNSQNSALIDLNSSLHIDRRLFAQDIDGSKAYADILAKSSILTYDEADKIKKFLEVIRYEWIENQIEFKLTDEDVHTVNERRLIELIGDIGEKLHTGRSRNDQIITDMKLWLKKAINEIVENLIECIRTCIGLAMANIEILMPGYTHLQRAQPILFSHWILNHAFAFYDNYLRLIDFKERSDVLPLGSGALAGNPFDIDREHLAKLLGFSKVTWNSIHAVGDRDFITEFIFCCSMISIHLSRFSEDLILYSTKEFNFFKISDKFSTGSSLMPQKCNPDSLELIRGSTGNIFGSLSGMMMALKGLPSSYNKDLQYDKKYAFEAFDLLMKTLNVMNGVLSTLKLNKNVMASSLSSDMLATDYAYYLVRKGVPFRTAHHIIGEIISYAEEQNVQLTDLSVKQLKKFSDKFTEDIKHVQNFENSIKQYSVIGGTSKASVLEQIDFLMNFLDSKKK